ncbi:GTP-binding protein [Paracoccus sp. p3-h83]|uniref:CobW family GTP-binding protein n=1 Tax=Paracoccus sp. p3-h83 TaxID=3342805 RepID=UPI0035B8179F
MPDQTDTRIPVTLLTGFLGSGKTTVLNHLIRDPGAGRIAVVMNEFGEAGLDHDLIEEATEETVLLASGCVCCSIRGDLARTLMSLLGRRTRGELAFDRVVIETTGLADPGPILQTLLVDDTLAAHFRMDGVITTVDCVLAPATLDRQFEAVSQIAMADLILLTKTDQVSASQIEALSRRIDGINPGARRIRADHGKVAPGKLFALSGLRADATEAEAIGWVNAAAHSGAPAPFVLARPETDPFAGISGLTLTHDRPLAAAHPHDARIGSASITVDQPLSDEVFDYWMNALINLRGKDILRMKGIVHVQGIDHPFVFHAVQHVFDPPVAMTHWTGADTTSRVVIIARDIDRADLRDCLETLRLRVGEDAGPVRVHRLDDAF